MTKAPIPSNEEDMLEALRQHKIRDTAAEQAFDDITRLAADILPTVRWLVDCFCTLFVQEDT